MGGCRRERCGGERRRGEGRGQVAIESQLEEVLAEHLNAEVAAGSVLCEEDAAHWLSLSFLAHRMRRCPQV
jgi:hypothetical protein